MRQTGIILGLCWTLAAGAGCSDRFADLIGEAESEVVLKLGPPQRRDLVTIPTPGQPDFFGDRPPGMLPGETFVSLHYPVEEGWHYIHLVSPAVFQRVTGRAPGHGSFFVLHVGFAQRGVPN